MVSLDNYIDICEVDMQIRKPLAEKIMQSPVEERLRLLGPAMKARRLIQ
jgi:hypothetical protein